MNPDFIKQYRKPMGFIGAGFLTPLLMHLQRLWRDHKYGVKNIFCDLFYI